MTAPVAYLIIGNSAGGIGAAEAIRTVDRYGLITIISDEPYPAYSRPLISEYLAKKCSLEKMLFRPADFYMRHNISTILGQKAQEIDLHEHTVTLFSGEKLRWEKLLLATGGIPIVPPLKGSQRKGVFTFTTLDDAKAIDQYHLNPRMRAVVIGGGLIGVSVTDALVKREVRVTIVEMKERILNTILDEEASAREASALREAGVNIVTGRTVAEINSYSGDGVTSVTLDDGKPLPCDMVIIAIGVQPRTELAADAGIKVNRGIVVDRHMATSAPDIYACGDAAEAHDFVYDECRLTPIWPNAYLGGRVAGFNMAGKLTEYPGATAMNSLKYFGRDVVSAGIVNPPASGYEVLCQKTDSTYRKAVLKDGVIVGMLFSGNIEKSGIVFGLMRDKINVNDFKDRLVAEDFGLVSLPEKLWRPRLEVDPSIRSSAITAAVPEEVAAVD